MRKLGNFCCLKTEKESINDILLSKGLDASNIINILNDNDSEYIVWYWYYEIELMRNTTITRPLSYPTFA